MNFSVYTRPPVVSFESKRTQKETELSSDLSQKIRRRLHSFKEESSVSTTVVSKAQKKKIARNHVLTKLMDQQVIEQSHFAESVADNLAEWSVSNMDISESVARKTFSPALVTTESTPSRNLFRIRIKL